MAELTRRGALLGGAGALGVVGVAAAVVANGTSTTAATTARTTGADAASPRVETLRRSDFAPGVGLVFTARAMQPAHGQTSRTVAMRLVEIVDVVGATDPEQSFTLLFETASPTHPGEGIHRLSSDATPHRSLMLSPVDRHVAGGTRSFQALVNTAA
jgi:hypothetical protein